MVCLGFTRACSHWVTCHGVSWRQTQFAIITVLDLPRCYRCPPSWYRCSLVSINAIRVGVDYQRFILHPLRVCPKPDKNFCVVIGGFAFLGQFIESVRCLISAFPKLFYYLISLFSFVFCGFPFKLSACLSSVFGRSFFTTDFVYVLVSFSWSDWIFDFIKWHVLSVIKDTHTEQRCFHRSLRTKVNTRHFPPGWLTFGSQYRKDS